MSNRKSPQPLMEKSEEKRPKNWSQGLLAAMNDPYNVVRQTKHAVAIRDKYPKAKFHYLVLPRDDINNIYQLIIGHIGLLDEFYKLYTDLQEDHKGVKLLAGFHAVPSMQRLHMHVISTDFISPCLKTKRHWNSFNTSFFIPYTEILNELNENSCVKKTIVSEEHNRLMATPLKCNQCDFHPKNMPELKNHLLSHEV